MIKNYFKTAVRSLLRHKSFSIINILGLTGGLTCSLLILLFVVDEYSYDKFHDKKDRIYRMEYFISNFDIARIPPVMGPELKEYFSETEAVSRMFSRSVSVQVGDGASAERFEEPNVTFADPDLFQIFSFDLVGGDISGALSQPFTVVLNSEIARKYFGEANPIGQQIQMEGNHSFKVIAVVKDFPSNSHVHFNMLVPYDNMYDLEPATLAEGIRQNFKQNWMVSHSPTYVLLEKGADPENVNTKLVDFVKEKIPQQQQRGQTYQLQPLLDIHLNDDVMAQSESPGSIMFIYIFIAVGVLTLAIACINYVNLSTARSLQRAKEIGMRKVLGAWKSNLIFQFLGESFVTTFLAAFLAFGLTTILIPQLNELTGKELSVEVLYRPMIIGGFLGLTVLASLLAGLYPAFFVTRVSPIYSVKGLVSSNSQGGLSFRKGLIVVQFVISVVLISSTLIVFEQLDMMRNRPLGFQKEHIINVPVQSQNFNNVFGGVDEQKRQKMNAFENELKNLPGVVGSTVSSTVPGFGMVNRNVIPEGYTQEEAVIAPVYSVDYDFTEVYDIEVVAGRTFSEDYGTDHTSAFLINRFAVDEFNFGSPEEALGKSINIEGKKGQVVGVVEDFNFLSLSQPMNPLIMEIAVGQFSVFSIKLANKNIPETLEQLSGVWNDFFPEETFDYNFLDESLDQNYADQERLGRTVGYFAILAILISCLGSYGLIMFIATGKMKEVGIRKVLGASVGGLVFLLSRQFLVLSAVAMVIAVPLTIWATSAWLEDFSYRIDLTPLSFVVAGGITIVLMLATISYQAIKAALSNPVKSLRTE
ncbi:ABC transporter permease [Marinoscillum sp.]|uniref:ABC transporter permease n=1 Tax=Marinoscillum sp. TaxID=2024838 RepID=UPI003BACB62B